MSDFIGARISLVSKSDIRYVGTLVDINSDNHTVSLDNVRSYGTEGRRGGGAEEMAPSDTVYEQIVFRGSDVKDLRIERDPAPAPMPQPPADPAIIGAPRPQQQSNLPPQQSQQPQQPPAQPQAQQQQGPRPAAPNQPPMPDFSSHFPGAFPQGYPGAPGGPFGRGGFPPQGAQGGFPGGPGPFPGPYGMPPPGPFGAPPGWYPPGQGFNQPPGGFAPPMPMGPPGQLGPNQQQQAAKGPGAPGGRPGAKEPQLPVQPAVAEVDGASKLTQKPTPPSAAAAKQPPPPPPVDSKPDVAAALAPPPAQSPQATRGAAKARAGRVIPAIPLASPNTAKAIPQDARPSQPAAVPSGMTDSTQAATAAVARAMADLRLQNAAKAAAAPIDNLTQKVNEMRADEQTRNSRQQGTGGYAAGARGGRGGRGRGGHAPHQPHHAKIEVPQTPYDFESANAKFNKQDLVKEAIASGSPMGEMTSPSSTQHGQNGTRDEPEVIPAPAAYDKGSSFFDNISSELKDREDTAQHRGQQFRVEERRRNMETFGQGSVDNYRGGFRGRGRGRRGGGGFGYPRGGRGGAPRGRSPLVPAGGAPAAAAGDQ